MRLPVQQAIYVSYEFVLVISSHMPFRFLQPSVSYLTGSISHTQRWVQWPAGVPRKPIESCIKGMEVNSEEILSYYYTTVA